MVSVPRCCHICSHSQSNRGIPHPSYCSRCCCCPLGFRACSCSYPCHGGRTALPASLLPLQVPCCMKNCQFPHALSCQWCCCGHGCHQDNAHCSHDASCPLLSCPAHFLPSAHLRRQSSCNSLECFVLSQGPRTSHLQCYSWRDCLLSVRKHWIL